MLKYIVAGLSITLVAWAAYSLLRKRTPEEKLAVLAKELGAKGEIFKTDLQGRVGRGADSQSAASRLISTHFSAPCTEPAISNKPAAFLLLDCQLFALDTSGSKIKRTKVLKTGFYLGFGDGWLPVADAQV